MNRGIAWFAANPIAANLLMVLVLAAGLLSVSAIRQETYPNVAFDFIAVRVVYPGATPDEVERAVCLPIEEAIAGVEGIDRIFSRATEGFAGVWAKLAVGADARRVLEEIKTQVDAVDNLPDEAERPIVEELIDNSVLLGVVAYGEVDERTLRAVGERVRDDVSALPEVTRAELVGVRAREIAIEVSEAELRRHGLTFDEVVRAVRASSVDLPGGALKTRGGEILMRAQGRALRGPEFERLVLLSSADGTRLYLGDVARVVDGFEETDEKVRFDGKPAAVVRLLTSERRNVLDVSRAVRAYLEAAGTSTPEGVELAIWGDQSRQFQGRRDLLLRNGAQGLALILLVLALFLRLRLAFWVSAGIPIAFLGALIVLAMTDTSINMMSLFAFIMALGLVVDDAIIVGESVARRQRSGADLRAAAIAGTVEVAVPVTVAVLTTVLFVLPVLSLPTVSGKIARSLGVVTIGCLLFSLVEALLILPAHLARGGRRGGPGQAEPARGALGRLQRGVDARLERFIHDVYRPLLARALRWPVLTLSIASVTLMLAVATVAGGWVRYAFFPHVEDDYVSARLEMPQGTPPDVMEAAVGRLQSGAIAIGKQLDAEADRSGAPVFEHLMVAIGDAPDRHDDFKDGGDGPNVGHVRIQLVPGERRTVTSLEVSDRWRALVGPIPGALSLTFSGTDLGVGAAIDISLSGADRDRLQRAAEALKLRLASYPGVREISDSGRGGKQELKLRIRPEAEALGLTLAELARQVRQGFHGEAVQRFQRGRDDVAVVVRYPPQERRSLRDLESIWIRVPGGGELPFSAVATAEIGRGYSAIERRDRRSNVSVTADVDPHVASANEVLAAVVGNDLPRILADHPGVVFALDGESRDEAEMMSRLLRYWTLALIAAYVLLAVPLGSYLQPLLILAAVPFGFVGAVVGHALLGLELSSFSMVGMVALTGVVVNDALVLIDRTNRGRAEGLSLSAALCDAGTVRFRAILLTSLTTFFGLLPLLFERSAQAAWLKPVAATLGFGVMFATAVTLVLVPAAYVLLEDATGLARRLAGWRPQPVRRPAPQAELSLPGGETVKRRSSPALSG